MGKCAAGDATISIFDWSDPEEMIGLLVEYVRGELHDEEHDRERRRFLGALAEQIESLARRADASAEETAHRLQEICDSQPGEFADDPALVHVHDCIDELRRISGQASNG